MVSCRARCTRRSRSLDDRRRGERAAKRVRAEQDADERVAGIVRPHTPHAACPAVRTDGSRETGAAHLHTDAEAPPLRTVRQGSGRAACDTDLVGSHGVNRRAREEARAILEPPTRQDHPSERVQVVHRRHQAGRARRKRGRLRPLAVGRIEDESFAGWIGAITGTEPVDVGDAEAGVDHAQRLEQPVAQDDVEGLAGGSGDEHAEHIGSGVVEPPVAGLVEERQRREPPHPFVRWRRYLRLGRTGAELELGQRVEERLRPRRREIHADAELERQQVVQRDRSPRGHRFPVDRTSSVDKYAPVRQFGKQCIDGIVEPQLVLLDEDERRHRHDRLRHRRDAEDAVAPDGRRFSSGEPAGDTDFHLIACGQQPGHTADPVLLDMEPHGFSEPRQTSTVESAHVELDATRAPSVTVRNAWMMRRACNSDTDAAIHSVGGWCVTTIPGTALAINLPSDIDADATTLPIPSLLS